VDSHHALRKSLPALALCLSLLLAGCSGIASSDNPQPSVDNAPAEAQAQLEQHVREAQDKARQLAQNIHTDINEQRKANGLSALQWDSDLATIALAHSKDMATRNYFDHVSPDGKDFKARYEEYGYHKETKIGDMVYVGGENLFLSNVIKTSTSDKNTGTVYEYEFNSVDSLVKSTVDSWMQSEGHRENILTPFSREGIGVFVTDDGRFYVTENFS
jgi:uncharacterized protein YkwD